MVSTTVYDGDLAGRTRGLLLEATSANDERRRVIFDEVVISHLWLARTLAYRFRFGGGEDEDILQVARSGLVEATRRFDPAAGDFVTYAAPTIVGLIKRHFRDHAWLVRPSRHIQEVATAIRREQPGLMQRLGANPRDIDLAELLGESVAVVRQAKTAGGGYSAVSLDSLISQAALHDREAERVRSRCEAEMMIKRLITGLSTEERALLRMRFVEQLSQADIAVTLGTNQMQVSRRLARLLGQLRSELGELEPPAAA